MGAQLFVGHDLGTHGNKAVLVDASGRVLATAKRAFSLQHPAPDQAEQDPDAWWDAVCGCTRDLLAAADVPATSVAGVGFAGQMLALVALDVRGVPTRPAISWLDARAAAQAGQLARRMGGSWVVKQIAGAAPTAKDIVPKVAWIRDHEPGVYARTAAFTDATGFLVARATGQLGIDPTGAAASGMLDAGTRRYSPMLARLAAYPLDKAPTVRECAEVTGGLTAAAAAQMGLREGTSVVAGLADIPSASVGAGATRPGDAHVCLGTSSWFAVTLDRARHAPAAGIVSVAGPAPGSFLMIGENETAGACAAWLAREIWPDDGTPADEVLAAVDALARTSPAGANGLLFAPWMFGERTPIPDADLRAAFVGLSLEHTRADVVRSVFDGLALNIAWTRDEARRAGASYNTVRVVGGGARGTTLVQALADALAEPIELVVAAQHAGAVGVALIAAVGVGAVPSIAAIRDVVRVERVVTPAPDRSARYRELGNVLREAQPALGRISAQLARFRTRSGGHP